MYRFIYLKVQTFCFLGHVMLSCSIYRAMNLYALSYSEDISQSYTHAHTHARTHTHTHTRKHTHTRTHTHTQAVDKLLSLISKLSDWAKEIPLSEESHQRFGNKAFKTWWEKVRVVSCTTSLSCIIVLSK